MKITTSRDSRFRFINFLEGNSSPLKEGLVRGFLWATLIITLVPLKTAHEVVFGRMGVKPNLKDSFRIMIWCLNRSWIPVRHRMHTFFDLGWRLSVEGCENLIRRGFVSQSSLMKQCDLAQLNLSRIRVAGATGDQERLNNADQEIMALISNVLTDGNRWASTHSSKTVPESFAAESAHPTEMLDEGFNNAATRAVLFTFDDLCRSLRQEYFLVSGTFLGVVRDNAFIRHDHDIDVGVFEDSLQPEFLAELEKSEEFSVTNCDHLCLRMVGQSSGVHYQSVKTPAIIRVVHTTGIAIDIFIHFQDGDLVWHGNATHRWNNQKFGLVDYEFLGRQFKGSDNSDRYLVENYGENWSIPDPDFDFNFDTPNLSFAGTANALVFFAWAVANAVGDGDSERVSKFVDMLDSFGVLERNAQEIKIRS